MTTQIKPPSDLPRGLRGKARAIAMVQHQQDWIRWCEENGQSYTGENGPAIRAADEAAIRSAEQVLAFYP